MRHLDFFISLAAKSQLCHGLLFHDERILRIGIEIEIFALEAIHVLRGENDAQSLVSSHSYQVAKMRLRMSCFKTEVTLSSLSAFTILA